MEIKLTEQQYNNLKVFLQRVELKGNEVPAFLEIVQALENSQNSEVE